MAFIPDEALRRWRRDGLTRPAWDVYEALCFKAGPEPGLVAGDAGARDAELAEWTGLEPAAVEEALAELRRRGWVGDDEGRGLRLLVGDFSDATP